MDKTSWDKVKWRLIGNHLGYSKEESELFKANSERFYAGVDPNEMKFRRSGCFDVGVQCGGWGKVIVEISMTREGLREIAE